MVIEVRTAAERFRTHEAGRTTDHSFSFGSHYDPGNVGFGLLVAHNDERLPPGTGYDDHPHRDVEIVTVVLSGALRHTSGVGSGVLGPGGVQRLSAGTGVVHAEVADDPEAETRFVQTWLRPSEPGGLPSYARGEQLPAVGLVPLVGGDAEIGVGSDTCLFRGDVSGRLALPDASRLHVFVVSGDLVLDGTGLTSGDAARLVDEGGRTITGDGVVLVWAATGR